MHMELASFVHSLSRGKKSFELALNKQSMQTVPVFY